MDHASKHPPQQDALHPVELSLEPHRHGRAVNIGREGILDSLEREGRIVRIAHPDDGRMRLVQITPRARHHVERAMARLHMLERRFMGGLTTREQALFLRLLGKLQRTVDRVGAEI